MATGWRAVCPKNGDLHECKSCEVRPVPHRFEQQVFGYERVGGRLVAMISCPHDGKRLVIAGEA